MLKVSWTRAISPCFAFDSVTKSALLTTVNTSVINKSPMYSEGILALSSRVTILPAVEPISVFFKYWSALASSILIEPVGFVIVKVPPVEVIFGLN